MAIVLKGARILGIMVGEGIILLILMNASSRWVVRRMANRASRLTISQQARIG